MIENNPVLEIARTAKTFHEQDCMCKSCIIYYEIEMEAILKKVIKNE